MLKKSCSTPLAVGGGVQARHAHSGDLATYKRGRGGQHSFSGTVATVFGSSGFLGRYVINRIAKSGTQVIVPYRGDPYDVMRMKVASDLGQMLFYVSSSTFDLQPSSVPLYFLPGAINPYEVTDEESIRKAVKYSNVVINLVGRDFETKNFTFEDVNVRAARAIARASRQMGVKTLVHVSALNASDTPPSVFLNGGSKFLRTKNSVSDSGFQKRFCMPDMLQVGE
ncbi:PREDICTED: NADH dehydrogenase [ubiquinone] 1 alpha subcomplex subunit 9, mitochondrial-like [Priapulus caudatus]|uniref:NADH dehydrogenase [ubiquinone] 1 alpha subcomplex subunit 9, mitochondrial n=1 Tax=Priapulus caudatus TaxID=37621 RepID=A0ABM1ECQ5_PRICU|nr:PREDICTED: NADH dehydrogenase [ubiquinone] 1 alpha subcomplex subunit 9, mitochondrial-like [Priapulus caudatus]